MSEGRKQQMNEPMVVPTLCTLTVSQESLDLSSIWKDLSLDALILHCHKTILWMTEIFHPPKLFKVVILFLPGDRAQANVQSTKKYFLTGPLPVALQEMISES